MNPEDFCRWLQGFAELSDARPTEAQWKMIKEHLQLLYTKVTHDKVVTHEKPAKDPFRHVARPGLIC